MSEPNSPATETGSNPPFKPVQKTPLSHRRLEQICTDACTLTLADSTTYEHSRCQGWNQAIINHILRAVISESTSAGEKQPPYKFQVNSTIIQHLSATGGGGGRRGMHSASGAYWNTERDGSWCWKHEAGGMDVVVTVMWIAIGG